MFDVTTGQSTQVAQHEGPIKVVKWVDSPQGGILATGSWDKTIKACIIFTSCSAYLNIAISIGIYGPQTLCRLFSFPSVATVWTYNIRLWRSELRNVIFKFLTSPTLPHPIRRIVTLLACGLPLIHLSQTMTSPLKWQTRVVSCFQSPQGSGFAVGSIEGRVAFQ